MDPEKLREYLETKCDFNQQTGKLIERASKRPVTAIVPVHLYGQTADMDPIQDLAVRYNLIVVEDACQAHGAEFRGRKVGAFGHGAFSLYGTKNMTTGEGGLITTDDDRLAHWFR